MRTLILLLAGLQVTTDLAVAQGVELDLTFNGTGHVELPFTGLVEKVIVRQDSTILASGVGSMNGTNVMVMARLLPNGALDASFGSAGMTTSAYSTYTFGGAAMELEDGKILQCGTSNGDGIVIRYNADGTLDQSFGNAGVFTIWASGYINNIDVMPDGRIILVTGGWMRVIRLLPDGGLDASFGTNGVTSTSGISSNSIGTAVHVREDGSILASGYIQTMGGRLPLLCAYDSTGTFIPSFGIGGCVQIPPYTGYSSAMVVQEDGSILLGGAVNQGGDSFGYSIYTGMGVLNTSFSSDGWTTSGFADRASGAHDMVLYPDDRVLLAGTAVTSSSGYFAMARYLTDGTPDGTFDQDGLFMDSIFWGASERFRSVVLQSDLRIVAGGYSNTTPIVVRYLDQATTSIGPEEPLVALLEVHPTIVSNRLWMSIDDPQGGAVSCRLVDVHGRAVMTMLQVGHLQGEQRLSVDLSGLASGTYCVVLDHPKGRSVSRVIKE